MAYSTAGLYPCLRRWVVFGILALSIGLAGSHQARAGCSSTPIAGGQQVDCSATTAPDPTPGAVAIPGGNNVMQIFSGTYNGGFSIPNGNNTITMTGGVVNVGLTTGAGNDQFAMQAGAVNGNIRRKWISTCNVGDGLKVSRTYDATQTSVEIRTGRSLNG